MALLVAALGCRKRESPDTSCTPRSVMVTLSSSTVTVFSARMESDRGDKTFGETQKNQFRKRLIN